MIFRYIPSHAKREMNTPKDYYNLLTLVSVDPFHIREIAVVSRHIVDIWGVSPDEAVWLIEFLRDNLDTVEIEIETFKKEYLEYIL